MYVRSDATNPEAVRLALDAFLQHATPVSKLRRASGSRKQRTKTTEASAPGAGAETFERRTAALFEEAGFIVSGPTERREQGADLAVWIDDVQHSLGSPLLVEVKAGELSPTRLDAAASQLREHVAKTHGRCGLLVYWDSHNRAFETASPKWPLILQLSGTALARLVEERRLIQELVRLRNAAVHGTV